jgi:hypothetical protein
MGNAIAWFQKLGAKETGLLRLYSSSKLKYLLESDKENDQEFPGKSFLMQNKTKHRKYECHQVQYL